MIEWLRTAKPVYLALIVVAWAVALSILAGIAAHRIADFNQDQDRKPYPAKVIEVAEDSPFFNCRTMGNHRCGPDENPHQRGR